MKKLSSLLILLSFITQNAVAYTPSANEQNVAMVQMSREDAIELNETRMTTISEMNESEIRARLLQAASEIEVNMASFSPENQMIAKSVVHQLQKSSEKKDLKECILKALKRTGQTGYFGVAMIGSTIVQAGLSPVYAVGGFFKGLVKAKMDKKGEVWDEMFYLTGYEKGKGFINGAILIAEFVILGAGPFIAFLSGAIVSASYTHYCKTACACDAYVAKLCKIHKKYSSVIVRIVSFGFSAIGVGIHKGVKFVVIKIKKLFKKKDSNCENKNCGDADQESALIPVLD